MTTSTGVDELKKLSNAQLVELFETLDAPTIAEMDGEFSAELLRQPHAVANVGGRLVLHSSIRPWQTKSFRPVDETSGRGYNSFLWRGRPIQRYPMVTKLAPSYLDDRLAYQLDYRPFKSLCGRLSTVDEIRVYRPGVYLGIGTMGFTDAQRRRPRPFVLVGPVRPYVGDIGGVPRR